MTDIDMQDGVGVTVPPLPVLLPLCFVCAVPIDVGTMAILPIHVPRAIFVVVPSVIVAVMPVVVAPVVMMISILTMISIVTMILPGIHAKRHS